MNYLDVYDSYIKYAHSCEEIIRKSIYSREDAKNTRFSQNEDINEIITNHRLKMINSKIAHTMRMISEIVKINAKLNFKIDLQEVLKVAILYHDIGRLRQATWSNTFNDNSYIYTNSPFINHGEDGYNIFINNDFKVDKKYIPIIGTSIMYHVDYHKIQELNYKYTSDLSDIDIRKIATGNYILNDAEWQVASLIVQLVADIDKIDILYQHLIGIDIVQDYVTDKSMKSLEEISEYWGISKEKIIEENNIDELNYIPKTIRIPVKYINISKLKISEFYKDCFYSDTWPTLATLKERDDWNFVTSMWWKLGVFLNQIQFYVDLENIEEKEIIPKMYDKIPLEFRSLFEEAFDYTDTILVKKRLKDNYGKIYL